MIDNEFRNVLIEQSKDLFWVVNLDFQLVYGNKSYLEFMKKETGKEKKFKDSAFVEAFGRKDVEKWEAYYSRAFRGDSFEISEHMYGQSPNEMQYSQITFEPLRNEDDEIFAVACQSKNITRLVRERFEAKQLMDSSLDVFCTIDIEGNFVYVSEASSKLWGYLPEELVGNPFRKLVWEEDLTKTNEITIDIFNGKEVSTFENRYKKKKGDLAYNLWSVRWDARDQLYYCVARDGREKHEQEEKIRHSEQRFKSMVQGAFELISILDEKGNYIYMSPSCINITGMPPEAFIGVNAFEFVHPDDIEDTLVSLKRAVVEDVVVMDPFRAKNDKGEWRWVEAVLTNMLDKPEVNGIVINSRDITERIAQAEKIKHSEQRYKALIQGGGDVTAILDIEGNYKYMSPASTELIGMTPEEFIGKNVVEFVHPDDVEKGLASLQKIETQKRVEVEPFRFVNQKNEVKWIEAALTNMLDNPAVNGIVVNSRDITEKVEREEKNKLIHQRYESLVENSMDCIVIISPEGKTTYVSGSVKNILGYTPEEVIDLNIWEICHPDDISGSEKALAHSIDNPGVPVPGYTSRIKHKDGSWRWIKPVVTNLLHDPAVRGFVDNFRDITEEVEEEQQLKLLESVITNTKDAVLITDAKAEDATGLKIIYINEAFTKMTGFTPEDVIGKSPQMLQGSTVDVKELEKLDRAVKNWETFEMTTTNCKKNGEDFWVNFTITPVANEKGEYTHWISIERDVTEQKIKELEKNLINRISDIFNESFDRNLTDCLTIVCKCIAELVGFDFTEIWLPEIDAQTINYVTNYIDRETGIMLYNSMQSQKSYRFGEEIPGYVWKNKESTFWKEVNGQWIKVPAKNEDTGSIMGVPLKHKDEVIGVLLIGTEKNKSAFIQNAELLKKLETTIGVELSRKKTEIELDQMFNFTPDMICVNGFDGYIKRINPAGLDILGYSLEEIRSKPLMSFVLEDDRLRTTEKQSELHKGGSLKNFENRYVTKDGKVVWLSWTASSAPELGVVYAVAKDVTEEKKLRELNRQVGKLAKIGSWEVDVANDRVFWSEEVHFMHGTDSESFMPSLQNGVDFYREDYRDLVNRKVQECIETGHPFDFEAVIVTTQQEERWVRSNGNAEVVDGECLRVYGSLQDITERKEIEKRLQSVADNLPVVVFQYVYYPDGRRELKNVTKGAKEVWGFTADEVVQNISLISGGVIAGGEVATIQNIVADAVQNKSKFSGRYKYVMPSGELRIHLAKGIPVYMTNGTIIFNSIVLDITNEAQNEELLKQTAQIARIGSWEMDLINQEGEDMYWSPMMKELFEVDESYNPTLKSGIEFHAGESRKLIKDVLKTLIKDEVEFDEEFLLHTGKGNQRWVRAIGKCETVNNQITKIYGSYQDIHAQKLMELQLFELNQALKQYTLELRSSNKELENFAYIASHDLQEPLRVITSYLQIIESRYSDGIEARGIELMERVRGASKRMKDLINALLEYSRIDRLGDSYEKTDLNVIMKTVLEDSQLLIEENNAIVEVKDLPSIYCEPKQIRRVFMNLLNNGIKYHKPGETPKVIITGKIIHDNAVEIEFADNGIGISSEFHDRIFEIFQRLHTREEYDGTGLGLATTKKTIERHNGNVRVESVEGEGAKFIVTLPMYTN